MDDMDDRSEDNQILNMDDMDDRSEDNQILSTDDMDDWPLVLSAGRSIPTTKLMEYGGTMKRRGDGHWSVVTGRHNIKYIHLKSGTNFSVQGKLQIPTLDPRCRYIGVFELELTDQASGWQGHFVVSLTVPGSSQPIQARNHTYEELGKFELSSNTFQLAAPQRNASLSFSLSHEGLCIRKGLIIKRFFIRKV